MKTKRLWIWSLIFGVMASLLVYGFVFMNLTTPASSEQSEPTEEELAAAAQEEEERLADEAFNREKVNPIVEIEDGKRAISLKVAQSEEGVSGYIEPRSQVDIIAYSTDFESEELEDSETTEGSGEVEEMEFLTAEVILQNVKVLASGKSADTDNEALSYETVTVEVTPEEGVMLSLAAKDQDGFYFMLRHEEDDDVLEDTLRQTRQVVKGER
ncbi:RcpC/CpaB family pilus assembly protein [Salipaludibacillus daqingensis]|uniref:RcpC/CpaB family pilus assembly protein n=1 Tax=Salipaludibacillus daqingensis TaxID=3041001 RepID=UPI002473D0E5|nr:RcpC/CpaB family pilus assembly protein [Salipaludibacillus daqingensis]